jgi:hypothetical protein
MMELHIGWPQGILIGWLLVSLIVIACLHGQRRDGHHNFALSFMLSLILVAILWWGGFFSHPAS